MTPRQLLDLWVAQRAVDLGHEFVADSQQVDGGLRRVVAAAAIALLCRAAFLAAAISGDDGTPRVLRGGAGRYGVSTARLTIFSFCSFLNSAATSSSRIASLPNCRRNMPSGAPPTIEAW